MRERERELHQHNSSFGPKGLNLLNFELVKTINKKTKSKWGTKQKNKEKKGGGDSTKKRDRKKKKKKKKKKRGGGTAHIKEFTLYGK